MLLFVVVLVSILLVDGVWGQSGWSARNKEREKDRQREKKKHEESHAHKGHAESREREENRGEVKQKEREELRNQRIRELREPLRGNFQNRVSRAPPYPEQNRFDGNPSASQKDKDRGRIARDRYAHAKHGREMKNNGSQRAEL